MLSLYEMKTKIIAERSNTTNTRMHDLSLSRLVTRTSIKSGGVKIVLWSQTSPLSEMMRAYKCFPFVSKMPTLA